MARGGPPYLPKASVPRGRRHRISAAPLRRRRLLLRGAVDVHVRRLTICRSLRLGLLTRCLVVAAVTLAAEAASARKVYVANENHTDYGWNDTVGDYEASMLSELDYYRGRIDATASDPVDQRTRFAADCWYYLWLYERNRSAGEFQDLINKIQAGSISVPLNPFVTLYGALSTEAAIRASYYPGRIQRRYSGTQFLVGEAMESNTIPWGMASIWAGAQGKYSWKGVCNCGTLAPVANRTVELFRWQGPDAAEILFKWFQWSGNSQSWGGYAEMRANLSQTGLSNLLNRTPTPAIADVAAFGYGWDDVNDQIATYEHVVATWNAEHSPTPTPDLARQLGERLAILLQILRTWVDGQHGEPVPQHVKQLLHAAEGEQAHVAEQLHLDGGFLRVGRSERICQPVQHAERRAPLRRIQRAGYGSQRGRRLATIWWPLRRHRSEHGR